MRLAHYFNTSAGVWLRLQISYNLKVAKKQLNAESLARSKYQIKPQVTFNIERANKACRRLGYASPIHGWLAQSAERITQTVGQHHLELFIDNHHWITYNKSSGLV